MKDQYVADIGDYGKYSMLKAFSDEGIKIGINWYYTPNDCTADGKHIKYLSQPETMRGYDRDVFDALLKIYKSDRTIKQVVQQNLFHNAVYFGREMVFQGTPVERNNQRIEWASDAENTLKSADLVFLDPDNGLLNPKNNPAKRGSEKYVLASEIQNLYQGHNVVYYCHRGRRRDEEWEKYKSIMLYCVPSAQPMVITFHKGTQRSYIFLVHPCDFAKYKAIIQNILEKWKGCFTEESIGIQNKEKIRQFGLKWLKRFKEQELLESIFNDDDFVDEAEGIGFVMDTGKSLQEMIPELKNLSDLNTIKTFKNKRNNLSPQLLGAAIFSQWRYFNHWTMSAPAESDREWFIYMLEWLLQSVTEKN